MDADILKKVINQCFPKLSTAEQDEMFEKVSIHLLEYLKGLAYSSDPEGLKSVDSLLQNSDKKQGSEDYGREIANKIASLPVANQNEISESYNSEMVRALHQLYIAVN